MHYSVAFSLSFNRYWDIRQQQPVHTQQLPERCYTLSVRYPLMVVGTADRNLIVYNLQNPQVQAHGGNKESSGLGDLFDKHIDNLTVAHNKFLRHWDQLIDVEAKVFQVSRREILHPQHIRGECSTNNLSSLLQTKPIATVVTVGEKVLDYGFDRR